MPKYIVTLDDGRKFEITTDSPEQAQQIAQKEGYASRVGSSIKKEGLKAGESIVRGSELIGEGLKKGRADKIVGGIVRAGLGPVASTVRAAFSPVTEAISPAVEKGIDAASDVPLIQSIASNKRVNGMLDAIFGGVKVAEEWAQKHPDAAASMKDAFDVASAFTATASAKAGTQAAVNTTKQAAGTAVKGTAKAAQKTLGDQPAKIMQRVARISKAKQAKFEKMAGESVGEYLTSRDIFGGIDDISSKLYSRFTNSKGEADKALESLQGTFQPPQVKTALKDLLGRETRVSAEGAPSPSLKRVSELTKKFESEGLTMSEINEVKRLFEKNIKVDFLKQNLPEGVARANNIDDAIRKWQFKQSKELGFENLQEINKETMLAKQLLDDIGTEYSGAAGNNAFTLSDYILVAGGDPGSIALALTRKVGSSKKVQSALAKTLNKGKKVKGEVKAKVTRAKRPKQQNQQKE